jgi:hypothetical protein
MTLSQSIGRTALGTAVLLLIPLTAKLFVADMAWTLFDFVAAGVMLFGAGLTFALIARLGDSTVYRLAVGVAVAAGLLLVWANLAVGLVGTEDNPANLLYGGVLAVALLGTVGARFRPLGMSRAMYGAALTYVVVTAIALFIWPPTAATAEHAVGLPSVLVANAAFAGLWVVAGWLFRRAGTIGFRPAQQVA